MIEDPKEEAINQLLIAITAIAKKIPTADHPGKALDYSRAVFSMAQAVSTINSTM